MPMPAKPTWESLKTLSPGVSIDRENNVLRGYVVAQKGRFKTDGRGEFNDDSLQRIVALMASKPAGTKSRFTHPGMSSDGLGSFLGRAKNPRLDGDRVRADLHLDPTSFKTPNGNLGQYVLDLAESDPDALSSSLVLRSEKIYTLDEKGRTKKDDNGEEIPPIWLPTKINASDIVDTGDAVDGLLSAGINVEGLPLAELWQGSKLLNNLFRGQTREVVAARLAGFMQRYLDLHFPVEEQPTSKTDTLHLRLKLAELTNPKKSS